MTHSAAPSVSRRKFLVASAMAALGAAPPPPPVVDTHMHVWSGDPVRFPYAHPYMPNWTPPKTAATVELLQKEMAEEGVTHCILVQTICHGWDNRYLVHCVKQDPRRFKGHGLIDPTDPKVAERLEYWMKEQGLAGMRFSPLYYVGKDDWLTSPAHRAMWKKAEDLKAVFNFYITTPQLPKLETMVRQHPGVAVVIDHLARIDLKQSDPLPEFRKLLALARYPNVYCKVSEMCIISPSEKYPYADTFPWVKRMYESFGPDRLFWGTGFPGPTRAEAGRPTLQQERDLVVKEIPFFTAEDRVKILGSNALRVWRF